MSEEAHVNGVVKVFHRCGEEDVQMKVDEDIDENEIVLKCPTCGIVVTLLASFSFEGGTR